MPHSDDLLARRAVTAGYVTPQQMREIQSSDSRPLPTVLVERGLVTPEQLHDLMIETAAPLPDDVAEAALRPDARLGVDRAGGPRFILLNQIGRGGMGVVHRAWETGLQRYVAIKFLSGVAPDDVARFQREAQLAARLSHPNIASVYTVDEDRGRWYIAMQYIDGTSADRLTLDPARAAEVIRDAANAIEAAHREGIVHRDLKPQNLMISGAGRIYVMDFGLAKHHRADPKLSATGYLIGTPNYMSPEQARGLRTVDARSDVYGLGATLYHLLTKRPPFTGSDTMDVLLQVVDREPAPPERINRRVPADLGTIALKCLEKDPARRYATARELADDLQRFLDREPIAARPVTPVSRVWRKMVKHRRLVTAFGAVALAALVAAGALWLAKRSSEEVAEAAQAETRLRREREARVAEARPLLESARKRLAAATELERTEHAFADALWTQGRAALEDLEQAERLCPGLAEIPHLRGRAYLCAFRREEALREFARAVERAPDDATIRFDRGRLYLYLYQELRGHASLSAGVVAEPSEETDEAAALREKAVADFSVVESRGRDPRETLFARGALALFEGRYEQATLELRKALDLFDVDADAHRLMGRTCLFLGRYRDAVGHFSRALEYRPLYWGVHVDRATARFLAGDADGAQKDTLRGMELMPLRSDAYLVHATILSSLGRNRESIEYFTRAIEAPEGEKYRAWLNRGNAHTALGDPERALADYDAALQLQPRSALAYYNRGQCHAYGNRLDDAIADFTRCIEINPAFPPALGNRCLAYLFTDRPDLALKDADRLVEVAPREPRAWGQRGDVLSRLRRYREAVESWQRALELDPSMGPRLRPLIEQAERKAEGER